ncbi:flagellar hook protein FlgE [Pseudogulbenkiania sp. MAI-1]|uniref:flagellar hook protein FlgE n=1 Tax=Pseudogulbenkiania sp. MAI-1 TaxID=990370 RepID=UPI00045E9D6C|nr:flagellar hook protein FlgE [Pseudogulbenkiania sp. MAI-1]
MGFQQGLSGLAASSKQLEVVGNNVANASTSGFKRSRTEFADMYGSSLYGMSSAQAGIGVRTSGVSQMFEQGNINSTGNNLDLAISGNGFFILKSPSSASTENVYSRSGAFQVNANGFLVNGDGYKLQGYDALDGVIQYTATPVDLQFETSLIAPTATSNVDLGVNLNSSATANDLATVGAVDPTDTTTFTSATSVKIYDSLGNTHDLSFYFIKGTPTATGTDWTVTPFIDGTAVSSPATPQTLSFDTDGNLVSGGAFSVSYDVTPPNGSATIQVTSVDLTSSTQFNSSFGVNSLSADGNAPGTLTSMNINNQGIIEATYSNGKTVSIGQVALANFTNVQGLQPMGGNLWKDVASSTGGAKVGTPLSSDLGEIQSGALEESNVDLTAELVDMIVAQRFYQANAQTIKTQDAILQTLINLR